MPLAESIERGLRERAIDAAKEMLQTVPPLEVVNNELIPALDRVGKGFEKGTVYLPQLLMSAEAAKAAFEVVKRSDEGRGVSRPRARSSSRRSRATSTTSAKISSRSCLKTMLIRSSTSARTFRPR